MESLKLFYEDYKQFESVAEQAEMIVEKISLKQDDKNKKLYNLIIDIEDNSKLSAHDINTTVGYKKADKKGLYRIYVNQDDLIADSENVTTTIWALFAAPSSAVGTPRSKTITNIYEILKQIFRNNSEGDYTNPLDVSIFIENDEDEYEKKTVKVKYNPIAVKQFIDYAVDELIKYIAGEHISSEKDIVDRQATKKELKEIQEAFKFDVVLTIKSSSSLNNYFKNRLLEKIKEYHQNKITKFESKEYSLIIRKKDKYKDADEVTIQEVMDKLTKAEQAELNHALSIFDLEDAIVKDISQLKHKADSIKTTPTEKEIDAKREELRNNSKMISPEVVEDKLQSWISEFTKKQLKLKTTVLKLYKKIKESGEFQAKKLPSNVRNFFEDFLNINIENISYEDLESLFGKNVLVVDDIVTSRTTMNEAIKQVKKNLKPKKVTGLVLFK
jgi:hypothetical protein